MLVLHAACAGGGLLDRFPVACAGAPEFAASPVVAAGGGTPRRSLVGACVLAASPAAAAGGGRRVGPGAFTTLPCKGPARAGGGAAVMRRSGLCGSSGGSPGSSPRPAGMSCFGRRSSEAAQNPPYQTIANSTIASSATSKTTHIQDGIGDPFPRAFGCKCTACGRSDKEAPARGASNREKSSPLGP